MSVSGYNHMPIFVNADTANRPVQPDPGAAGRAGQKISFSYFDAGDAAGNDGSVQVLAPPDATGSITSDPVSPAAVSRLRRIGERVAGGQTTYNDCTAPFVKSERNLEEQRQDRDHHDPDPGRLHLQLRLPRVAAGTASTIGFGHRNGERRDDLGRDDHR